MDGSAMAAVINIDLEVDAELDNMNNFNKFNNYTVKSIPGGSLNENVSYSDGYLTGWNTLQRTGHCTISSNFDNTIRSFDVHVGLRFFVLTFGNLHLENDDTGSYFQVKENSIHFGVTFANTTNCSVALYALAVEKFRYIVSGVSNPRFNKYNFEQFFQVIVRNQVNRILAENSPRIQNFFQHGLCDMSNEIRFLRVILTGMQYLLTDF